VTYSSEVLADSPLVYWRLNGGAGTDSSGNGRTATTNNTMPSGTTGLLVGDADGAGSFNGTTQNLVAAYASWMDASSAFSVDFLLNTTQTSAGFLVARDSSTNRLWQIGVNVSGFAGKLYVTRVLNASDVISVVTTTSTMNVNDGVTRHVGITYDGTTLRLYINGVLDASSAWSGGLSTRHPNITVGYYYSGSGFAFAGVLDEIAYYGSTLSSTRVAAHYAAGVGGGTTTGTFSATLPTPVTAAFTGTYRDVGTFSATLPQVTASLSGTYAAPPTGDFAATLPSPLTTDFAGTYTAPANPTGSFAATLPAVTASFAGDYHPHEAGTFDAVLPFPTADFTGTYTPGLETGSFAATLPVVTADFAGTYSSPSGTTGTFAATLPLVVAAFTGTYDGPTPTDTSNALNGRVRHGSATVTITRPVAAVPPSVSLGQRYDKALAFPEPVMDNGRPT
jgi:hypothetical protein